MPGVYPSSDWQSSHCLGCQVSSDHHDVPDQPTEHQEDLGIGRDESHDAVWYDADLYSLEMATADFDQGRLAVLFQSGTRLFIRYDAAMPA